MGAKRALGWKRRSTRTMIAQSWPRSKRMSHRSNRCLGRRRWNFRRSSAARVEEQNCAEVKRKHSATLEEPRENAELYREAVSK